MTSHCSAECEIIGSQGSLLLSSLTIRWRSAGIYASLNNHSPTISLPLPLKLQQQLQLEAILLVPLPVILLIPSLRHLPFTQHRVDRVDPSSVHIPITLIPLNRRPCRSSKLPRRILFLCPAETMASVATTRHRTPIPPPHPLAH